MEWSDEQIKELEMLAHKSPVPCASKGAGRAERDARPLPPGGGGDRLRAPTECWHLGAQLPSSGSDGLRGQGRGKPAQVDGEELENSRVFREHVLAQLQSFVHGSQSLLRCVGLFSQ